MDKSAQRAGRVNFTERIVRGPINRDVDLVRHFLPVAASQSYAAVMTVPEIGNECATETLQIQPRSAAMWKGDVDVPLLHKERPLAAVGKANDRNRRDRTCASGDQIVREGGIRVVQKTRAIHQRCVRENRDYARTYFVMAGKCSSKEMSAAQRF